MELNSFSEFKKTRQILKDKTKFLEKKYRKFPKPHVVQILAQNLPREEKISDSSLVNFFLRKCQAVNSDSILF